MIIICHHYKYLKLIKSKATKLSPELEKGMSIRVCKTGKSASLDSSSILLDSNGFFYRKPNVIGI